MQPMSATGSSVSMQPPPGFTPATNFAGFENLETNSSISIIDFPAAAYEEISAEFLTLEAARDSFAQQHITVTAHQFVDIGGVQVPFVEGTQMFAGNTVNKFFTLLQGDSTVLVTFNIFDTNATPRDDIIDAVQSIQLREAASLDEQLDSLPFSVDGVDPFNYWQVLGGVSAVLSTTAEPDPTGQRPIIVVSHSLRAADTSDLGHLSRALMNTTDGFETAVPFNGESIITPAGTAWRCELENEGRHCIQYVWATEDSHYLRLLAAGNPDELQQVRSAVTDVANSVRKK